MRHHFRVVAVLVVCLIGYRALLAAFHWINQPRDSAVLGGISLIVVLLLVVPLAVREIWRSL
jgi:hypothetical protein